MIPLMGSFPRLHPSTSLSWLYDATLPYFLSYPMTMIQQALPLV
jgi:hypothetical protein